MPAFVSAHLADIVTALLGVCATTMLGLLVWFVQRLVGQGDHQRTRLEVFHAEQQKANQTTNALLIGIEGTPDRGVVGHLADLREKVDEVNHVLVTQNESKHQELAQTFVFRKGVERAIRTTAARTQRHGERLDDHQERIEQLESTPTRRVVRRRKEDR